MARQPGKADLQMEENMSPRDAIIAAVRGNLPRPAVPLPEIPGTDRKGIKTGLGYKDHFNTLPDVPGFPDESEPILPYFRKQLEAMKDSYDGLWKVYLFVHPIFHDVAFIDAHKEVELILGEFASTQTGSRWRNAIDFDQLLRVPIDNPSLLAQQQERLQSESEVSEATAASESLDPNRVWSAADVLSILRPLTARDADNLQKIATFCTKFASRVEQMTPRERGNAANALQKIKSYQPKKPFVLNRLGRYDADTVIARLEKLLGPSPERDAGEGDE